MKKFVFLHGLLFSILFCASHSIRSEGIVVERKTPLPRRPLLPNEYRPQEGFCGNTLVKTPFGYEPIKTLREGDIVIGGNGKEKIIVAITKHHVNRCVKLIIHNTTMYVGYDQMYYNPSTYIGVKAYRLKPGDMVLCDEHQSSLVTYVELINEHTLLYFLTVEDHIFRIDHCDVWVHNAEPLVLGLSSTCLGGVITINPITATIGATIALSTIAHKAYQAYIQDCPGADVTIALPSHVMLAERFYYIERLAALQGMYQELLSIKNGLENLKALCSGNSADFTYQFLKQTVPVYAHQPNQLLQISSAREMQLSDNQKENLRIVREAELQHMEQEIVTLQTVLAFHINELIEQMHAANDECASVEGEIHSATTKWNENRDTMTDAIAFQAYKMDLLEDCLLKNLEQKVNEFKIVAQYYHKCMKTACLKDSTNIADLLEKMNSVISEFDQKIVQGKSRIARNTAVSEQYYEYRRISIGHAKNEIKAQLQKNRNGRNAQAIAEAKNKLESIVVAGSPQNNNNKNDDESEKNSSNRENSFKTAQEATKAAKDLGFEKTNYRSQGQPVFKKGNRYISPDVDCHNGGVWKMADSVQNLGNRTTRMGTYDAYLNWIGH